jgi:mycothiol synthase
MPASHRTYSDGTDFIPIRELIRRAFRMDANANAWSFAHFDIWSQRQLGREQVLHLVDWQQNVGLWEQQGLLRGAAVFDPECSVLILDPSSYETAPAMLDWLEIRWLAQPAPRRPLLLEVFSGNIYLSKQVQERGYCCEPDFMYNRQKSLVGSSSEAVVLPLGYYLRPIESHEDYLQYVQAVTKVFNFQENIGVGQFVHNGPSAMRDLDLLIMTGADELAAFCNIWVDWQNSLAEFEPVGTLPDHQKRGLGMLLLAEGCNRLRKLGIQTASVDSWSESVGANKLYEKAGFINKRIYHTWQKVDFPLNSNEEQNQ